MTFNAATLLACSLAKAIVLFNRSVNGLAKLSSTNLISSHNFCDFISYEYFSKME